MRLVVVQMVQREGLVGSTNPEHAVGVQLQWLERSNHNNIAQIELAALVESRPAQVFADDLGSRFDGPKRGWESQRTLKFLLEQGQS